jgi:hypothetical protein
MNIGLLILCIKKNKESSSISGHTDFFYPNLTYQMAQYQQDLPEITKIKRIPMPSELIEQFNRNIINRKN